jgi:hypothetical protein
MRSKSLLLPNTKIKTTLKTTEMVFQGISAKVYGTDLMDCSDVQPVRYMKGNGTTAKGEARLIQFVF